ncbi:hypothetical protein [Paracoccus salipaludis]|uniref:hypothetical protein n=1 Tax=Paracoccus salipaludis TaxID=2032623 RepID=UPI001071BA61|nr:hypothetical protein [Paracoccus salipaludis]
MDIDFLEGNFDIQTLRLLSGSGPDITVRYNGSPVFVAGKAVLLFNAYDALEMALRDELLSTISDQDLVDLICGFMLDDFACAVEEARDASDLQNWLTAANLSAACMMGTVLPRKIIRRISVRLRSCLRRLRNLTGLKDLVFS